MPGPPCSQGLIASYDLTSEQCPDSLRPNHCRLVGTLEVRGAAGLVRGWLDQAGTLAGHAFLWLLDTVSRASQPLGCIIYLIPFNVVRS